MAKRTSKKTSVKTSDDRSKFIFGLFLIGIAVFITIAFLSYFWSWQADQQYVKGAGLRFFTNENVNVTNICGKAGSWLSYVLISRFLGIGAFGIPLLLLLVAFRLLKYTPLPFTKTLWAIIFGSLLTSIVFSYMFSFSPTTAIWLGNGMGGLHGKAISDWLSGGLGKIGAAIILIILIITYALFLNKNTLFALRQLCYFIGKLFKKAFKKISAIISSQLSEYREKKARKQEEKESRKNDKPEIVTENNTNKSEKKESDNGIETVNNNNPDKSAEDGDNDFTIIRNEDNEIPDFDIKPDIEINIQNIEGNQALPDDTLPDYMLEGGELYDPTRELSSYMRPPIELLEDYKSRDAKVSNAELEKNKDKIVKTLGNYKIGIDKIIATIGPTVTLYEIVPKAGIRISSIRRLEDDIALSLAALGIRIIAPIPGKGTVGIEVPNEKPDIVSMQSIIKSAKFQEAKFELPVALGKTISNETFVFDLAKMPHLLVAGATGQGKSVGLNAILTSLLYKKHPAELKIVMVDPKKVELTPYAKIEKHFLAKMPESEEAIITDTQKVVYTIKSLCIEMDNRYDLLKIAGVRNVKEYNEKFVNRRLNPLKGHRYMPYIVLVIDEFADLIMTAGREIEEPIARLAQLARAIGIHLVIATQRPTTNIITGLIKANFPARIAFRVTSMIDSRTILDSPGANQLIGRGDMLVSTGSDLIRVQCAFVDTPEVDKITDFIGKQPGYAEAYELPEYSGESMDNENIKKVDLKKRDDLFEDAARLVVQYQQGSTSLLQRKMELGYNRAGRIMDQLEAAGIVGPSEGSKARQVYICDFNELDAVLERLRAI